MTLKERLESMHRNCPIPESQRWTEHAEAEFRKAMGGLQATFIRRKPKVEDSKPTKTKRNEQKDKDRGEGETKTP